MKARLLLCLVALAHQAAATPYPTLQWDPETTRDCVGWHNNIDDASCEWVRDYFTITPEQFHKWNPSVGLDCSGWHNLQSYCIVTQERLDNDPRPWPSTVSVRTAAHKPTRTATLGTLGPSPTAWQSMGCHVQIGREVAGNLDESMFPDGDSSLTVSKCLDACYRKH